MQAWGRALQARQGVAFLLLLGALTLAMVGGVTGSWLLISLGAAGMLAVLVPMATVRSHR